MTGTVVAVCISGKKGERKIPSESARLRENHGIVGDAHAGEGDRQVSLLAEESIRKMRALGLDVGAGDFAENITTRGVGVVGVRKIGKECHDRCSIYLQAGDCVMPREGIFTVVVRGGTVRAGDPVAVGEPAMTGRPSR